MLERHNKIKDRKTTYDRGVHCRIAWGENEQFYMQRHTFVIGLPSIDHACQTLYYGANLCFVWGSINKVSRYARRRDLP